MATPTFFSKINFSQIKSESRRSSGGAREKCGSTPWFHLFSPASCPDPLVIPVALEHRARIPYFPASCLISFYLSRHRARISFVFSDIVTGSPSHSGGSSASCPNPLFSSIVSSSFYLSRHRTRISFVFFGIVPESPIFRHWVRFLFIFLSITPRFPLFSPASCSNPLVIPAALRHRAWIPYFPTSCSVAFYLSRHRAWISFVFFGIVLVIRAQLVSQLIHVQLATWLRE